jgi:alanine dehydrogenase
MKEFSAAEIHSLVSMSAAVDAMRRAFEIESVDYPRSIIEVPGGEGARLCLLMPGFDARRGGVVKVSTVYPDNRENGLPTIQGTVIVLSAAGTPVAIMDSGAVTQIRTGAASALASTYLSRQESSNLLLLGTGSLAPHMALAHCTVRPIKQVTVWGRTQRSAVATAEKIRLLIDPWIDIRPTNRLEDAVRVADIICCATGAAEPLISGAWLRDGCFVDLVGSFSPSNREVDDEAIVRSRVFVDTYAGALTEAGDLLGPLSRGVIKREHILGQLTDLVSTKVAGRTSDSEITLFKSVGASVEDLALAHLILDAARQGGDLNSPSLSSGAGTVRNIRNG